MTSDFSALEAALNRLRKGGKSKVAYRAPTADRSAAYQRLLSRALTGGEGAASEAGFVLSPLCDDRYWLLSETSEQRAGSGAALVRRGAAAPLIVEAPHTFFDIGTLEIALHLFLESDARALLINTVHRAGSAGALDAPARKAAARSGAMVSDVAHQPSSLFGLGHETLLQHVPNALGVQVHGFADRRVGNYDAVLSGAGTGLDVTALRDVIREAVPELRVARYPDDVSKLGGTRNAQAVASQRAGADFVHMELSASARRKLLDNRPLLTHLALALRGHAGGAR